MHIRQAAVNIFNSFVLFNVFAEGTMTQLHICKFVLILNEKLATIFAHIDCNIRHNIFEVTFWIIRIEVTIVQYVNLLIS